MRRLTSPPSPPAVARCHGPVGRRALAITIRRQPPRLAGCQRQDSLQRNRRHAAPRTLEKADVGLACGRRPSSGRNEHRSQSNETALTRADLRQWLASRRTAATRVPTEPVPSSAGYRSGWGGARSTMATGRAARRRSPRATRLQGRPPRCPAPCQRERSEPSRGKLPVFRKMATISGSA
jgi:hypothetical protein